MILKHLDYLKVSLCEDVDSDRGVLGTATMCNDSAHDVLRNIKVVIAH